MTSPFSKDYVSQIDLRNDKRDRKLKESAINSLAHRRQSDDPNVRLHALGTIPGLSAKSDAARAARSSGQWPKGKELNQPPKNARAVLPHDQDNGKQAKLSRGRSI
ncbi:hypothetical protein [Aquabacterium sp.]|uniref:hypothetical protein n=1 Tax=Aquabacterium sp. TaxID=1872578 RepID=UPI0035B1B8E0